MPEEERENKPVLTDRSHYQAEKEAKVRAIRESISQVIRGIDSDIKAALREVSG